MPTVTTPTGSVCSSLLVDEYSDDWSSLWWVRMDGHGRVVDDPAEAARAIAVLAGGYEQYSERPPAGPVLGRDIARWSGWRAADPAAERAVPVPL